MKDQDDIEVIKTRDGSSSLYLKKLNETKKQEFHPDFYEDIFMYVVLLSDGSHANVKEETGTNLGLSKSMNNVVGCNTNKNKI